MVSPIKGLFFKKGCLQISGSLKRGPYYRELPTRSQQEILKIIVSSASFVLRKLPIAGALLLSSGGLWRLIEFMVQCLGFVSFVC